MSQDPGKKAGGEGNCKARILLVGFNPTEYEMLSRGLQPDGYGSSGMTDTVGVLEHIYGVKGVPPDVLLLDLTPPCRSGMELIKIVHGFRPGFPIIAVSSSEDGPKNRDLEARGIPVLCRPVDVPLLEKYIQAFMSIAKETDRLRPPA